MVINMNKNRIFDEAWYVMKAEMNDKEHKKKIIDKMDNVKMSPHGDVILMDGL